MELKREGIIRKCTAYACIGVDLDGQKEVLSLHVGGAESAKYWVGVMNELQTRTVKDILIFCADNLTEISETIGGYVIHNRIIKIVSCIKSETR